jgi:hypothetical protein
MHLPTSAMASAHDTEIKVSQTMPYGGPVSAYGAVGRAQLAYFAGANAYFGQIARTAPRFEAADRLREHLLWQPHHDRRKIDRESDRREEHDVDRQCRAQRLRKANADEFRGRLDDHHSHPCHKALTEISECI